MNPVLLSAALLAAYLLGAVPFALLLARTKGIDIRTVGSGNVGATNVFRGVSRPLGLLTFFLDALKGFVPAAVFPAVIASAAGAAPAPWLGLACGGAAVAGHAWPVYLRFRGGKGVATGAGMLLGVAPFAAGVGVLVWAAVFLASRYVSLASVAAAVAVPAAAWLARDARGPLRASVLTLLGALIVWRHRANLARLARGTESRLAFGRRDRAGGAGDGAP